MAVNGIAMAGLAGGALLFWSGFKGWGVVSTLQDIISGKGPSGPAVNAPQDPLTMQAVGSPGGIAADAMQYQGHAYRYGGAPGTDGSQPWDCSSFCNWVLSHDLGLSWPGAGRYDGTSHGPPTGAWAAWFLARGMTVSGGAAAAQAGDVIVWAAHMGIALGGGQMISALDQQLGTAVTPVTGQGTGPVLVVGRY